MVQTEKAFAAYSVVHGTKAAFRQFHDSTNIVCEKGKAVNVNDYWAKRENVIAVLHRHPVFGAVSISGGVAFITVPRTFLPKKVNDSFVARGQYATV